VQEFGSPNLSRPLRLIDKRVRAGLDVRRSPHVVRAGSGTRPPRSPRSRPPFTAKTPVGHGCPPPWKAWRLVGGGRRVWA